MARWKAELKSDQGGKHRDHIRVDWIWGMTAGMKLDIATSSLILYLVVPELALEELWLLILHMPRRGTPLCHCPEEAPLLIHQHR